MKAKGNHIIFVLYLFSFINSLFMINVKVFSKLGRKGVMYIY